MKKVVKVSLIVIFTLFLLNSLNAAISGNDISEVYPPDPQGDRGSGNQIEGLMIEGASLFFQSYGAANLLLSEGELFDKESFSPDNSLQYVNDAVTKLELSRRKYDEAFRLAVNLEYIKEKIAQLKDFDYIKYAVDNHLIIEIMGQVAAYLKKGDVKGYYKKNIENIDLILSKLYAIRGQLNVSTRPETTLYWDLLRLYSQNLLFGNYATAYAKEAFKTY